MTLSSDIPEHSVDPSRGAASFLTLLGENLIALLLVSVLLSQLFGGRWHEVSRDFIPPVGFTAAFAMLLSAWAGRRLQPADGVARMPTALPLAPSRTGLVLFLTGILGPVFVSLRGGHVEEAVLLTWEVGMASCFLYGLIGVVSALTWAPLVRRCLPRSAALATVGSLAVVALAVGPASVIFEQPYISLPVLAVLLLTSISRLPKPLGVPPAVIGLFIGVLVGLGTGQTVFETSDSGPVGFPLPLLGTLMNGLNWLWLHPVYLLVLVPISLQGTALNLAHLESAASMGDAYPTRRMLAIPAVANIIGGVCGCALPCDYTLGYQAYRRWGSTTAYVQGTGLMLLVVLSTGALRPLLNLIPEAAWAPLFLLMLVSVVAQNFRSIPPEQSICLTVALIPQLANLLVTRVVGLLSSSPLVNISAAGAKSLILGTGGHWPGQQWLAEGADITSLLWAGIAVAMVRGWPGRVSAALLTGCLLSGLGVIHGNQLGLHFGVFSAGYLGLAIVFRIAQVLEPVEPSPARVLPEDFDENDSLSSASGSISTGEAVRPEPAH